MIPKFIHYCWFGRGEESVLMKKCISSWKKFLPEYEIKVWNEDNFDVNSIPYTRDAYKEKKYAFVSDYVRLCVLYQYGGLYFDVDVELIKSISKLIERGPFLACESTANGSLTVNPGLIVATTPQLPFWKTLIDSYKFESFYKEDGSINNCTINIRVTSLLKQLGWTSMDKFQHVVAFDVYPSSYFCPMDWYTKKIKLTSNTYSIHWYAGSWLNKTISDKIKSFFKRYLPDFILAFWLKRKKAFND